MEQITKQLKLIDTLKWLSLVFGVIMYEVLQGPFGELTGGLFGVLFGYAFLKICRQAKGRILCDVIVDDLREALAGMGQDDCVFEVKLTKPGMIIRVYLMRAREMAPRCTKAIMDAISRSWYRPQVWITQVVDVASEEEMDEAEAALNEELIRNLSKGRGGKNRNRSKE